MKKILAVLLVSLLVLGGCGSKDKTPETPAGEGVTKIGTGVISSVKNLNVGENERDAEHGKFESNVTYATVVIENDKIVSVSIDTAQNELKFTNTEIVDFAAKGTKKELGADYGMNWDEQIADLEEYLVGKSASEIKADTAASDLSSSVSITVDGYIDVVQQAITNAVEVKGLVEYGQTSTVSAKAEEQAEIGTTVSALGTDADGKVVYAFIDEMQQKANIAGGKVEPDANLKTKGQLGAAYGMNWDEQVAEITKYLVGKTATDFGKFDSDVSSSVSIYTGGFEATVEKAFKNLNKVK